MFVIGVAGQAQMGKDTVADRLQLKLNEDVDSMGWQRTAFAKNVKQVFVDTFGVDLDFIEEWKVKAEAPPGFDKSVRKSLQFIGDGFRQIKGSIWLDLTFQKKNIAQIISDVRYVNEFVRVYKEGGINVLVGRTDKLSDDPNGSEAQIKPYVEWFLNNTSEDFVKVSDVSLEGSPEGTEKFHVFIRNDKSIEELYEIVDSKLVSFAKEFVFNFTGE